MEQVVQFVNTRVSVVESYVPTKFEFRGDKRFHWLQKMLFWILSKIGCFAVEKVQKFERVTVQKRRFMENLYNQQHEIFMTYAMHGKFLLIGPEDLSGLLDQEISHLGGPVSFTAEYNQGLNVLGMNVVVIPWMRGMLVIPKEAKLEAMRGEAK